MRIAWWTALASLAGLLVAPAITIRVVVVVWLAANGLLALAAIGWSCAHLRTALRNSRTTLRWSFWMTIIIIPMAYWMVCVIFSTVGVTPTPLKVLAITVVGILPAQFLFNLLMGFVGQAVSAFVVRRRSDCERGAQVGTRAWWIVYAGMLLATTLTNLASAQQLTLVVTLAVFTGLPLLTALICVLAGNPRTDPDIHVHRWLLALSRRLVLRRVHRSHAVRVDLRGAAIGLLVALGVQSLGTNQLLLLLQGTGLISLVQLYNSEPDLTRRIGRGNPNVPTERARIVIVDFDLEARRLALSTRSEAALQAEAIGKLKSLGVGHILLAAPYERSGMADLPPGVPEPQESDRRRSVSDLPLLTAAIRRAGNVTVSAPTADLIAASFGKQNQIRALTRAAGDIVGVDLPGFGSPQLPAMMIVAPQAFGFAMPGPNFTDAPVRLLSADRRLPATVNYNPLRPDVAVVAGQSVPLVPPGEAIVDFHSERHGNDFRHVTYSELLHNQPIYVQGVKSRGGSARAASAPVEEQSGWIAPSRFYPGKIVLLNDLNCPSRPTPVGVISRTESIAYATATLLAGSSPRAFHTLLSACAVLVIGFGVGYWSSRRTPLAAGWRVLVLTFAIVTASCVIFVLTGARWWLDPVVPSVAAVTCYVVVTQFAFAQERIERERNRDLLRRFVAPQVVEELLDDPEGRLGLGGSRRLVGVLFADVRNFTPFAEGASPEEVIEVVNAYMTALTDVLYHYEGILDKYTGDGLMATFRIGADVRADVCRAVQAALAMRDRADELSRQRAALGLPIVGLGFGLHYGEAVVGLVGNPNRFEYTALGYAVVVGARLQTLAAASEVIVSDAVYYATAGAFEMLPDLPVHVKGMTQTVHPYHVRELRPPLMPLSPQQETAT